MKSEMNCIPCILRQTIETVQLAVQDEAIQKKTVQAVLRYLEGVDYNISPPALGKHVYQMIYEMTGNKDPFYYIKQRYNTLILSIYDDLKKIVFQNPEPVQTAAKLAVAGNTIDFGAPLRELQIEKLIHNIHDLHFEIDHFEQFILDLKSAKKVLYLADNAGEIVFDRLFIEMLNRYYPEIGLQFTVVVRGAPVLNDATMDDARIVGLDRYARIIHNGDNAPATILSNVSEEMKREYESADIIISKGMGNYETLDEETRLIYYLLRVKCPLVAKRIKSSEGSLVFKRNEDYKEIASPSNQA
jgi:uncharacterized protein with ATP-grasp and redox domains